MSKTDKKERKKRKDRCNEYSGTNADEECLLCGNSDSWSGQNRKILYISKDVFKMLHCLWCFLTLKIPEI